MGNEQRGNTNRLHMPIVLPAAESVVHFCDPFVLIRVTNAISFEVQSLYSNQHSPQHMQCQMDREIGRFEGIVSGQAAFEEEQKVPQTTCSTEISCSHCLHFVFTFTLLSALKSTLCFVINLS